MSEREVAIRPSDLRQPPSPVRVYRRDENSQRVLIDPDWRPPKKKKRSGREVYRDGMIRRSARGWYDSPGGDF